jgi:hypothetical protein
MKATQEGRKLNYPTQIIESGPSQSTGFKGAIARAQLFQTDPAEESRRGRSGRRGRRAATIPNRHHLEVMEATKNHTYEEVATQHGISRQRVGQIVRRWKHLLPVRRLPFRKSVGGSVIEEIPKRKKKENRIHVLSFRLTSGEMQSLRQRYPKIKSANHAARGIVTKFLTI